MNQINSETPQVTIRDVARLAGVSIKTVSRVVNNMPHVREQTRIRVQSAVDKLNYSPNLVARQLGSMRSKKHVPFVAPRIVETSGIAAKQANGDIDWW